nr:E3 ubiquitin-protein ligase RNF152 isoform X2 [Pelodiscus sinensis]|eukprot:XP_025040328.1 E3 ubiquitin-protein ligase RNF152 isoform X2 [Pelodiscus sinensis]
MLPAFRRGRTKRCHNCASWLSPPACKPLNIFHLISSCRKGETRRNEIFRKLKYWTVQFKYWTPGNPKRQRCAYVRYQNIQVRCSATNCLTIVLHW